MKPEKAPVKRIYKLHVYDKSIKIPVRTAYRWKTNRLTALTTSCPDNLPLEYADKNVSSLERSLNNPTAGSSVSPDDAAADVCYTDDDTCSSVSTCNSNESEVSSVQSDSNDSVTSSNVESSDNFSDVETSSKEDENYSSGRDSNDEMPKTLQSLSENEQQALKILSVFQRHNLTTSACKDILQTMKSMFPNSKCVDVLDLESIYSFVDIHPIQEVHYCGTCDKVFPNNLDEFRCSLENCGGFRYKGRLLDQQKKDRQPRKSFILADTKKQLKHLLETPGSEDMESPVCDPRELFENIGRLVMEARTPDTSVKGRVEGPHCPPQSVPTLHSCDSQKEECHRVQEFRQQLELLWRNRIPMRLDVLLFPDCYHGKAEARTLEGTTFSCDENFLLLERWDLQLLPKRAQAEKMEGMVSGQFLFQAVRSYLHFSQLSSWLISTEGALSLHIVYRVYAPGESVSYSFSVEPEIHKFPLSDLGHMIMLSSVASLPRQGSVAVIPCKYPTDSAGTPQAAKHREETEKMEWAFRQFPKKCTTAPQTKSPDYGSDFQEKESRPLSGRRDHTDSQENRKDFYGPEKLCKSNLSKPPSGRRPLRSKGGSKGDCLESKARETFLGRDVITVRDSSLQDICDIEPSSFHNVSKDQHRSAQILESFSHSHLKQNVNVPEKKALKPKRTMSGPGQDSAEDPVSIGDNIKIGLNSESKLYKKEVPYSPQKTHPYQKPTSLFTPGNQSGLKPIQTTKRLPSPKVLMTGSTKPMASFPVKRCLNLDEPPDFYQEDYSNLNNLKLEALTVDDIQDFSKPLSPSQIEAYLSSLSSPIMGKSKASQLQQIPTTKCKFFIGEDENNVFQMTDSKEGFDTQDIMTTEDLTNPGLSKIQTTPRMPGSEHPLKPSSLFHKSFFTSEVEDDFGRKGFSLCPDNGDIIVFNNGENSVHNNDSQISEKENSPRRDKLKNHNDLAISSDVHSPHNELVTSQNGSTSANSVTLKEKTADISVMCNFVEKKDSIEIHQDKNSAREYADENFLNFHDKGKENDGHNGRTYSDLSLGRQNISDQDEASFTKGLSLCKQLLKRDFAQNVQNGNLDSKPRHLKTLPSADDMHNFQLHMERSASIMFNAQTGLPTRSSPAPIKKKSSGHFDYDSSLTSARAIKNAISCSKLTFQSESKDEPVEDLKIISTSAPASTNCLLGNFEESVLNGRIEPVGVVEGFTVEVGAGGSFCPKHVLLPVAAYFFQLSDDNAPSPYLGHVNLEPLGKRGYHIPRRGTVQVTLFNPNKTVVKMFVVMYDLSDMPANCQTFLRQRTVYMPVDPESSDPSFLRYLIHLRLASSKSGKIYLHTDIRLIFARDKFEFDPQVANYELRSFTEGPHNPKYSPKR